MALPTNASWDVGVNPTAAYMNARIRDTIQWLRNRPRAVLATSGSLLISNQTVTNVAFTNELIDSDGGHSNATQPSRYLVQTPGIYYLNAKVSWVASTVGVRDIWFSVGTIFDTSPRYGWQTTIPGSSGTYISTHMLASTHLRLEVGDEVYLTALHSVGSSHIIEAARAEYLWVCK